MDPVVENGIKSLVKKLTMVLKEKLSIIINEVDMLFWSDAISH